MTSLELEERIGSFNHELRKRWFSIALIPAIVLISAFSFTLLKLPGWLLIGIIFTSPFAMSVQLTRLMNTASIKAGLLCPHCGAALGGYIKYLRKNGRCPSCSKSVLDPEPSSVSRQKASDQSSVQPTTMRKVGFTPVNTTLWVIGTASAAIGAARFKPHLGAVIFRYVPILESEAIAWGLVIVGFTLLTVSLIWRLVIIKRFRVQADGHNI